MAFEKSMLMELEKNQGRMAQIGAGNLISMLILVASYISSIVKKRICEGRYSICPRPQCEDFMLETQKAACLYGICCASISED